MKTSNLLSNLSPNNSVLLIIFVFLFIAVGMFFFIQRTTEKKEKDEEDKKNRLIEERKELTNQNIKEHMGMDMDMGMNMDMDMGMKNINQNGGEVESDSYTTEENTVTETFNNEVGLFIKKDETHPEIYSHNPLYIPPFNTGKETRCVTRHINRPNETINVQSCSSSDLVKMSSNASY
jgi:hypothetical protein